MNTSDIVYTWSNDGTIRLWNSTTGQEIDALIDDLYVVYISYAVTFYMYYLLGVFHANGSENERLVFLA